MVLLSNSLPDVTPFSASGRIVAAVPDTRIIALGSSPLDTREVANAMMAGACGFLPRDAPRSDFVRVVRANGRGDMLLTAAVAEISVRVAQVYTRDVNLGRLTLRERQVLLQDVKCSGDGVGDGGDDADGEMSIRDGVSKDRMLSVHDSELRHGHKSSRRRFDGHKAAVVDTDSQLITAVDVLPGNAWDSMGALELVEQSEASAGVPIVEAMGDTAYGDGGTRQDFSDAGRKLVARVPGRPDQKHFPSVALPKGDFVIDLAEGACICPAGKVTRQMVPMATRTNLTGRTYKLEGFRFDGAMCGACPLRSQCVAARPGIGRTVRLHPQEALLQEARALQKSPAFAEYRQLRVVVEHRLARLFQLGIRQARYFGRAKTKFQLYLAATVANLTLLTDKMGLTGDPDPELSAGTAVVRADVDCSANQRGNPAWDLVCLTSAFLLISPFPKHTFRPNF